MLSNGNHMFPLWCAEGGTVSPSSRIVKSKQRGKEHHCSSGDISDVATTCVSSEIGLSREENRQRATPLPSQLMRPDHVNGTDSSLETFTLSHKSNLNYGFFCMLKQKPNYCDLSSGFYTACKWTRDITKP
ncbi:hypothetical protein WISP_20384 [Willisornis vidua]|uniref:Uncharacterized protein n=1 Tax=Willisornis vidua TaxID=1566151 RepID=A0ABQ9DN86_9PASS|nr:hypothetical protein WISP_20384 [Willisornis vidua]